MAGSLPVHNLRPDLLREAGNCYQDPANRTAADHRVVEAVAVHHNHDLAARMAADHKAAEAVAVVVRRAVEAHKVVAPAHRVEAESRCCSVAVAGSADSRSASSSPFVPPVPQHHQNL